MISRTGFATGLLALAFLTFTLGCAGSDRERSTGEYIDDTAIAARVTTALSEDPEISLFDIRVQSFKGQVQLSGFVDSKQAKKRAADIARNIEGVGSVKNNLLVK